MKKKLRCQNLRGDKLELLVSRKSFQRTPTPVFYIPKPPTPTPTSRKLVRRFTQTNSRSGSIVKSVFIFMKSRMEVTLQQRKLKTSLMNCYSRNHKTRLQHHYTTNYRKKQKPSKAIEDVLRRWRKLKTKQAKRERKTSTNQQTNKQLKTTTKKASFIFRQTFCNGYPTYADIILFFMANIFFPFLLLLLFILIAQTRTQAQARTLTQSKFETLDQDRILICSSFLLKSFKYCRITNLVRSQINLCLILFYVKYCTVMLRSVFFVVVVDTRLNSVCNLPTSSLSVFSS